MTVLPPPPAPPLRLVLANVVGSAGWGDPGETNASSRRPWVEAVAAELAARLALTCLVFPRGDDPVARLAALQAQDGPWLAPLPDDPGAWLGPAGRWAELLGAFRQPTVLLVPGPWAQQGLAAASTALLVGAGVPLVGLIQWGATWDPERRRAEGLPWLGWVEAQEDGRLIDPVLDPLPDLARALQARWRALDQWGGQSGSAASGLS
ncbi:hypothetical protein [Cyanobium sp. Morenito 9A2]|uniref:hypothetical protein n=1 Tax=Cyanobium sp. Morenito 9A2 TaxID=2823718 RepID=UPI0020CCC761|nr:hypothetical protein [Cyanobium sp. Morenito 9A2]MCP9848384.1 hypothetical protein [Cyanobium sp. Morenito 9A2]